MFVIVGQWFGLEKMIGAKSLQIGSVLETSIRF